ncbi:hypothetical protein GINT2_000379 [Glugoides intestinalis]
MNYKESRIFKAIILEKSIIESKIEMLQPYLLSEKKIPNIIHLNKHYENFEIDIAKLYGNFIEKDSADKYEKEFVLALLSENTSTDLGFKVCDLVIKLNANFFSHTELISRLTGGKIQFSAYEMIGDIIHLNLTEEQHEYKQIIADVIFFKTNKTVINKTGKIEETFRFYHSEVLAGTQSLITIHIENGIRFFLDLGKVYWCSRLQTERLRILNMIEKHQVVCDPFCGVGPHVLPAIKKGASSLCNDLNPFAIECLKRSLEINKLTCDFIENMDAGDFLVKNVHKRVHHFIFNLPEYSLDYIKYTEKFHDDFWLHVFFFCKETEVCTDIIKARTGYTVKQCWLRDVRKVSPSKRVVKLEVFSKDFFAIQEHHNKEK